MNTAFLDAQNLAWKIHAVESGFADRALLRTYQPERRAVAEALLNFDNKYAKLFSQRPPAADEVRAASRNHQQAGADSSSGSGGSSSSIRGCLQEIPATEFDIQGGRMRSISRLTPPSAVPLYRSS